MNATEPNTVVSPAERAIALDALRGLAVALMCLSGVLPRYLPNWMYHGYHPQYLPGPDGAWQRVANPWTFHGWASFTWVDWVFPMFLFAMGAAFPLALERRLARGESVAKVALAIVRRGVLLAGFAVFVRQIEPHFVAGGAPPATLDHGIALLGFAVLFPVFAVLPRAWPKRAVRCAGVAAAAGLVAWIHARRGTPFSWGDFDIIILLLAHASIVGSLAWLFLRRRLAPLRVLVLLFPAFVAHELAMQPEWRITGDGFESWRPLLQAPKQWLDLRSLADTPVLDLSPLYDFTWYKFLWVVVPATWIGDHLRAGTAAPARNVAWLALAAIVLVHVGLARHREPMATWAGVELSISLLIAAAALPLVVIAYRRGADELTTRLLAAGGIALALGLAVEPLEGGIKKGPPSTLSWYLVSVGLSSIMLVALGRFAHARVWRPIVLTGQNPMLAYAAIRNLLAPLVALPLLASLGAVGHDSLDGFVLHDVLGARDAAGRAIPWLQAIWAFAKTALLVLIVAAFTCRRLVWRS